MESLPYAIWGRSTFSVSLVEIFPTFRASYIFAGFSTKLKYGACRIKKKKMLLKVLKYSFIFLQGLFLLTCAIVYLLLYVICKKSKILNY